MDTPVSVINLKEDGANPPFHLLSYGSQSNNYCGDSIISVCPFVLIQILSEILYVVA